MRKALGIIGSLTTGLVTTVALTVSAAPAHAADATLTVPSDFNPALSDTRATGHYEVVGTGLHLWTEGATSTDKVAEYVDTSTPLAGIGEPSLDYTNTAGGVPGFQLVVDFDGNGSPDGILVGEPVYGGDWWASNSSADFVKTGAPHNSGGSGSPWHGTLDEWRASFPDAQVTAFGFSLGSGVKGDGVLNAIEFDGDRYTFRAAVVLGSKDDCKKGGWATSTDPEFRNQGDCVSYFARQK